MNRNVNMSHIIIGDPSDTTQSPNLLGNDNGGDNGWRTGVTSSRGSLLPPLSQNSRNTVIQQQLLSQNVNPVPRHSRSRSMSQPSSTSFLPVLGPSTFGDSRATPSLLPTWNPTWNHRTPGDIAMVGVESNEDQLVSQYMNMDNNEAALEGNENVGDGIGRRPGKEIAGSGSHSRNVSVDCYGDGKSSTGVVSTNPPNSSVNSRLFTDNEMKMIMADEKLKKLAITSPKDAKRMISNRESAARSKMKKAQQLFDLNTENATLRAQNNQLQANYNQLQSDYSALENQMREMMIHNQGLLETGRIKDELIEQHRRDSEGMSMQLQQLQSLDMVQQLNTNHLRNQDFDGNI